MAALLKCFFSSFACLCKFLQIKKNAINAKNEAQKFKEMWKLGEAKKQNIDYSFQFRNET